LLSASIECSFESIAVAVQEKAIHEFGNSTDSEASMFFRSIMTLRSFFSLRGMSVGFILSLSLSLSLCVGVLPTLIRYTGFDV
jgi:hypothetical protein